MERARYQVDFSDYGMQSMVCNDTGDAVLAAALTGARNTACISSKLSNTYSRGAKDMR